jgi:hypothetical protein
MASRSFATPSRQQHAARVLELPSLTSAEFGTRQGDCSTRRGRDTTPTSGCSGAVIGYSRV